MYFFKLVKQSNQQSMTKTKRVIPVPAPGPVPVNEYEYESDDFEDFKDEQEREPDASTKESNMHQGHAPTHMHRRNVTLKRFVELGNLGVNCSDLSIYEFLTMKQMKLSLNSSFLMINESIQCGGILFRFILFY